MEITGNLGGSRGAGPGQPPRTHKKKSKKKSPQKSGETEYPAMDQEEYNRLLQNAIEQIKANLKRSSKNVSKQWKQTAKRKSK